MLLNALGSTSAVSTLSEDSDGRTSPEPPAGELEGLTLDGVGFTPAPALESSGILSVFGGPLAELTQGIPSPLPPAAPAVRDAAVPHAPKRHVPLTPDEIRVRPHGLSGCLVVGLPCCSVVVW